MKVKIKEYYKISILFALACAALVVGVRTVDKNTRKTAYYTPSLIDVSYEAEPETISIPYIILHEEEADEYIAKLREEKAISARAKASYVKKVEAFGDSENRFWIAAAVCHECGGENEEIMMLVASVMMNRVASPNFPNSVYGVLTQKYQYGVLWLTGIAFPGWATDEEIAACFEVADRVLSGERACPENVVYQAEFEQGSGIYAYYPGFYFCYE